MIHVALLATLAFQQGTGGRPPVPGMIDAGADTVSLFERVAQVERGFLAQWYNAWRASETKRLLEENIRRSKLPRKPELMLRFDPRRADISCAPEEKREIGVRVPDHAWGMDPIARRVRSQNGKMNICPNWLPPRDTVVRPPNIPDERYGIDGALEPEVRDAIVTSRRHLIALLDTAANHMPANGTITGQRVRFLVDQGDLDRAETVARECTTIEWWCTALAGYVQAFRGNSYAAETLYAKSAAYLIEEDQCKWTNVRALLDSAGRAAYGAMSCGDQLTFNDRVWWLGDPLWSVRGNDRYVEQFTRQMLTMLHAATDRDERYNWLPEYGGDALREVIARYGWPSYTYWGQPVVQQAPTLGGVINMANRAPVPMGGGGSTANQNLQGASQSAPQLGSRASRFLPPGPAGQVYGYFGYPAGGPSPDGHNVTIESFYANVVAAFKLSDGSGIDIGPMFIPDALKPPAAMGSREASSIGSTLEYSIGRVAAIPPRSTLDNPFTSTVSDWLMHPHPDTTEVRNWWPREHYLPAKPIVQLVDYQSAILRRDRSNLLAFSTNLGLTDLERRPTDSVETKLMVAMSSDRIEERASRRRAPTDRAVFLQSMPDAPVVVSVEVPWDTSSKPAARTRFGMSAVPPLARMKPSEKAISDPVLFLNPIAGRPLPMDANAMSAVMLGGTTISTGTEAVGVYWETYGFAPNDSVEVSIRVQRGTSVAAAASTPITMSWKEPDPAHASRSLAGAVPIQMRSVAVSFATLQPGAYTLEISVGHIGATPVKSQRAFTIR